MKKPILEIQSKNGIVYKQFREYLPLWIYLATLPIIYLLTLI